ncbi:ribonuclease H, partial [Trifolium pratense]
MHSVDVGEWRGIKAGRSGPMVSHLMFADDLLLFGEASEKQMRCVMNILNKFCLMSGQEVSQEKTSILFSKNVNSGMRDKLLHLSGFREAYDLDKYLGVPLIGRAPKKADYQYLIDQVSNKLVKWKARQLSFAGRVTLAKSVLEAVPTYPMMTSRIPQSYLDEIQKIQRNFIWGDTENVRRYHAVRWSVVTMPKDMGGLGLRRLDAMNKACLLKLGWKLNNGSTDFWCEVLRGKYGSNSLTIEMNTRSSDSNLWKSLINLRLFLLNNTFWNIGEGCATDAWNKAWIEPGYHVGQHCEIPSYLDGARVSDLVDEDGRWNWQIFQDWMPSDIQGKIAAILPPSAVNGCDEPAG